MLTKATADGTLYKRDWDIEPLFPLPNADAVNKEYSLSLSLSLTCKNGAKFCLAACFSFCIFSFALILIFRIESYKEKITIESTLKFVYFFYVWVISFSCNFNFCFNEASLGASLLFRFLN
jgi:hypothetical protein